MPFNVGPGELIIMLIITAIVFVPIVALLLVLRADRSTPVESVALAQDASRAASPDPRAVLADRLARGEISRDDFDTAMRALGYVGPTPAA
jgi:uncharacterized membrane protein